MTSTNNNLKGIHLFAPIIQLGFLEQNNLLKEKYVPLILRNYHDDPNLSPDWNIHTSYNQEHLQKNKLNWDHLINEYTPYIENSINAYFKEATLWDIVGTPWYNVYGDNQSASQHSHAPDQFSFVHFLQYNPQVHNPLTFVNPQLNMIKYLHGVHPILRDGMNNYEELTTFKEEYSPEIYEGSIIIFPSYLEHYVRQSISNQLRITIAFNFNIK